MNPHQKWYVQLKGIATTVWPCIGPKSAKRIPSNLGSQFATLEAKVSAFINILTSICNP
jgi:hypothetical protein